MPREPWCDPSRKPKGHLASVWDIICRLFGKGTHDIAEKIEALDKQQREVRHELRNIKFQSDALLHLVETMRGGDSWRREDRGPTNNVQ
jgi:hypothetical protein